MNRIIQQNIQQQNKEAWIDDLSQVVTDLAKLLSMLELEQKSVTFLQLAAKKQFAIRVPLSFISRIEKGNINDPLLKQVICDANEMIETSGYSKDPLLEQSNTVPNILHKYHNRALLMTKTSCAINCRYCFRRHFPYQDNKANKNNLTKALEYIKDHKELDEIILSGGDPLMAKDHELKWLINELEAISHIKRLRIHSRLVVVIPNRVTDVLCSLMKQTRLNVVVVTHINHPNEIDDDVVSAMAKLKCHGVTLLNQSVLLKEVNDNEKTLINLSNRLFDAGILPYYLHVLDKVQGAAHFFVEDKVAKLLMKQIATKLSGYLVPKLVREIGGEKNKTVLHY